ncbi:helix-turn-helix domain-containing protein [Phosphitispora sp. TUW77]|uniref:helix-turn-helix domain-containing protein n=1 Tax=Phosphitispora sp. TUW77 TaxID=3152361 RepID=UPI003AB5E67B
MNQINLVIVGAANEGINLCFSLLENPNIKIHGIVNLKNDSLDNNSDEFLGQIKNDLIIFNSLDQLDDIKDLDLIIDTTRDSSISDKINKIKRSNTTVIESSGFELLTALAVNKEIAEAELFSLLSSIQDSVVISDNKGFVKFINKTFEKYIGLHTKDILNYNIFEKYPGNPLDHCAKYGQQITGQKYSFGDDTKEFSYTVNPIFVRETMIGVVGVFRLNPDIFRLMEELQRSTSIIEGLYDRLGQINGLDELNISDVMAIDKMERIMLRHALTRFGYSVQGKKKAAKALNISLATLYNKLKKYQIN